VALAAVRPEPSAVADEVRAIAYVFDPEQDVSGLITPVCRLLGLSLSETKLACALVAGDSLGTAAQRLGVQEQTARTYLKHIFEKTETNRQAQLVQLMLKNAVRMKSGLRIQAFT
jgi:DNA-binding CsgD family transcriptional regulator